MSYGLSSSYRKIFSSLYSFYLLICLYFAISVIQIKWYKGSKELDPETYPITHTDGVITIEIINSQPGDSGKYKCVASNSLGSDSSDAVVIVEGQNYRDGSGSKGNN